MRRHRILLAASLVLAASASLRLTAQAPVTYERLLNAAKEPQNYFHVRRRLLQHALQHALADYAGERQEP